MNEQAKQQFETWIAEKAASTSEPISHATVAQFVQKAFDEVSVAMVLTELEIEKQIDELWLSITKPTAATRPN